jgi:hypothetical protein
MQQGWRLDMLSPYRLLNARRDDETMLITDAPEGRTGVEVRTPSLDVTALSQVPARSMSPATGWDARFENVTTTLYLPPGHRLLGAWGVDESPDAWLNQWQLLDLFLLMLVAAAAYRLAGWVGAAIASAVIVLTHVEPNAPAWLWINLLVAVAIVRALPASRLRTVASAYQLLSLAALTIVLVPFAIQQYRLALHPQLEIGAQIATATVHMDVPQTGTDKREPVYSMMIAPAIESEEPAVAAAGAADALRAPAFEAPKQLDRYAPGAMLQTGPGIPDWQYLSYRLHWSGPVDAQQTVRLAILSPLWMSVWRIGALLLSAALLALLVSIAYGGPRNWRLPPWQPTASAAALVLLLTFALTPHAYAQTPDAAVLTELKKRMTQPAKCAPDCAEVVLATVDISGDRLDVQMEAHAQAHVGLAMPQAGPQWVVERVLIDDHPSDALARPFEVLQLPLTPGVHRVRVSGRIAQADELSLEFAQPPRRIAVRAAGWDFSGSSEGRLLNNVLQLTRRTDANAQKATAPQRFPPFVRIERRLSMNLDWTLSTIVERLAPEDGAFTVWLPLLTGEAVLTPGLEVRDGHVLVSMAAGEGAAMWESALSQVDRLHWSAAADQPWVEQWEVIVSPMWHAGFSGTPPIMPAQFADGVWINQFLPRPGEPLSLTVQRPVGSAGTTLAVDRVHLTTSFGQRLSDTTLEFAYRSSQGGRHDLHIPKDARVDVVMLDGNSLPLRPTDGVLPLTVMPGAHTVVVALSSDEGAGLTSRPPPIELGANGTNVRTSIVVPADRWVLFVWGRGVGPAILYWGELLVFAAIAIVLGRSGQTPLRTRDWLLLGLGLSTFSWWVLLVFGTWLFVIGRRSEWRISQRMQFNAMQLALALFSLAAIALLISAIPFGLLGQPDMGIHPDAQYMQPGLSWFLDRTGSQLPQPMVLSVSIWFYKMAMLLWAMWLSFALLRWLPWAWRQFSTHGCWMSGKGKGPAPARGAVAGEA